MKKGTPRLDHHPQARVETLPIGVSAPQCGLHEEEEHQRHSQRSQAEEAEEAAPEHPSMRTLIGTTDDAIIQVAEQVYQGSGPWTPVCSPFSSMMTA